MTTELDIESIRPGRHYTVTETARLLGVDPSSLYRNYFKELDYFYDLRGRRVYTGYSITTWWNTVTDPRTGKRVTLRDGKRV